MPKPRWWPALIVVALTVAALVWTRAFRDATRQQRVLSSAILAVLAGATLLLWLLLLSRLPWKRRLQGVGAAAIGVALLPILFEYRGVSGDLIPIFAPRWERAPNLAPPPAPVEVRAEPSLAAGATDYPQFLGPARTGVVPPLSLARDWQAHPPRELWRSPIGAGWAGFAVAGGVAYTLEQRGEDEDVVAYDLLTGRQLWGNADRAKYDTPIGGPGPRSVPAVTAEHLFALGATGRLRALDRRSGRLLWLRDLTVEHGATNPEWGKSCSPLAVDGLVIASAGGPNGHSLVAYHAATGELAWQAGDSPSAYSSPLVADLAGERQVVIFNQDAVAGHRLTDGRELWRFPWPAGQPNVSQPVLLPGDRLFVSSGYGIGSKLLALRRDAEGRITPALLWESPRLKAKFTNVVLHGEHLYGLDDGVLVCLDPKTGERCWKEGRFGHGQVILTGDLLLVQTEDGEVVLLEPNPTAYKELTRFTPLNGKTWNPPALAGRYLVLRNDREAVVFELEVEEENQTAATSNP